MDRRYKRKRDSSKRDGLVFILVTILIIVAGYIFYKDHQKTSFTTSSTSSNTVTTTADPYFGWKTYSDSNLSLQYPGGWTLTESTNQKVGLYATSSSFSVNVSGLASSTSDRSTASLFIQIGAHSGGSWCADISCRIMYLIPLSAQLTNYELALVNQSGASGNTTVYMVVSKNLGIGTTSVNPAIVGNNLSITGYPEYISSTGASNAVARVSDFSSFQSSSDVTDLVSVLNTIKFK